MRVGLSWQTQNLSEGPSGHLYDHETTHSDSIKIDLTYDKNDHYYGVINEGLSISYTTSYEGFKCRQNMAVVKEGQWFKDRNTGKNFELVLH